MRPGCVPSSKDLIMPNPPGMRVSALSINETDAVHVYSSQKCIWLQLRRNHPTKDDIGISSFKSALQLSADQAIDLARELLTAVSKAKPVSKKTKSVSPVATTKEPTGVERNAVVIKSQPWTPKEDKQLLSRVQSKLAIEKIANRHKRPVESIERRLQDLTELAQADPPLRGNRE